MNLSWLCVALTHALFMVGINSTMVANNVSKPGCLSMCGDVEIPYPFGIIGHGENCSLNYLYEIKCNSSFNPPKPFLLIGTELVEVYNISNNQVRVAGMSMISKLMKCYNSTLTSPSINLEDTPYTFSESNMVTVIGCDEIGFILGGPKGQSFSGCLSFCLNNGQVLVDGECSGYGCCQASIPKGTNMYIPWLQKREYSIDEFHLNNCSYVFLAEQGSFTFHGEKDLFNDPTTLAKIPTVFDWGIVVDNVFSCSNAKNRHDYACNASYTSCIDSGSRDLSGYNCKCIDGYEGNPYLQSGCYDIDECKFPHYNECTNHTKCINTPGSYTCHCSRGYTGDGRKGGTGCDPKQIPVIELFLGLSFGLLSLLVGITWLYLWHEKRKLIKKRAMFFQQNGGLLMTQRLASNKGGVQSTKIFTAQELEKATNKYADDMILGRGGYGTVYKGILPDQTIVAIKKSKISDESQIEQFINEVIILVQINHRNVVKLLGCCLEAEVPLLVYEYVSNGTLLQHIPDNAMTWENRLRIAAEAAGSLAYLHSAASKPIIHRDVKSANILLDESYTAKIADFGASRLVPLDQVHVTTLVQGTIGYLDPEYLHTGQLTEKSDVYSFGVVLAELLTGQKPICYERSPELRNLATYFTVSMKEKRLFQILESRVIKGGALEQLQACGELVKRCLKLSGEDRPTMKEVAMELESLRKFTIRHPWVTNQNSKKENVDLISENEVSDLYTVMNRRKSAKYWC